MAEEIKVENTEEVVAEPEKKTDWPYASYPDGFNKLLNKVMPFWARPAKKMMGSLLIKVLVDG